jgi:hypothetical protein
VRLSEQTLRAYTVTDCVAALDEALRFAEHLPEGPDRDRLIVNLVGRHGLPLAFLGRLPEVATLFRSHETHAERLGDHPAAGPFYVWLRSANHSRPCRHGP